MFKKVLIANRGEIATRIVRACRELGRQSVALYEAPDQSSLHVRLADECVLLKSPAGFMDQAAIIAIAKEKGADAIHPGYGFLAEQADFITACERNGLAFIGPPAGIVSEARCKIETLARARQAGFPTVEYSRLSFSEGDLDSLLAEANRLGYPLVVKSCSGGRGPGERLVQTAERLAEAVRRAQAEAQAVYGARRVYLEKAILPAHQIGVQVLGDQHGRLIHLGEREGSLQYGNRKVIEESPAPCLSQSQRERLWQTALDLARLFNYQGLGTVEFLVDEAGRFYFTEIKARIQVEHPLTEMISRVDLVREQIRLAAGEPLGLEQRDVSLSGWAMLCRIRAEDPWRRFLPSPGRLQRVRLPAGPEIRLDTYVYGGCNIPAEYDSLIAKLTVWAPDRAMCVERMRRALEDLKVVGVPTNLPLLQQVLQAPEFAQQSYSTDFLDHSFVAGDHNRQVEPETHLRDLAVAAAVLYVRRNQLFRPSVPERLSSGWHQDSRRLPQ